MKKGRAISIRFHKHRPIMQAINAKKELNLDKAWKAIVKTFYNGQKVNSVYLIEYTITKKLFPKRRDKIDKKSKLS